MYYFGGKFRTSTQISSYINSKIGDRNYIEPFVGGAWVLHKIKARQRHASDICKPLISLYQKLQQGWDPPSEVSETEYSLAKQGKLSEELEAFIGFGCSFSGKWFGGYARDSSGRNYAKNARNSLLKKRSGLLNVSFTHSSYLDLNIDSESLIYCDPPYSGTTGYPAAGDFDSNTFWNWVRKESTNSIVLVSEYKAPEDFISVLDMETKTDLRVQGKKEPRIERIFIHESRTF